MYPRKRLLTKMVNLKGELQLLLLQVSRVLQGSWNLIIWKLLTQSQKMDLTSQTTVLVAC